MSTGVRFFDTKTLSGSSGLTMSGTAKVSTDVINVSSLAGVSFDCRWGAGVTGALIVEASLDNIVYYDLAAGVTNNPGSSSATGTFINNVGIVAKYCRVSYTNAAGSGTLTVLGFAREFGT